MQFKNAEARNLHRLIADFFREQPNNTLEQIKACVISLHEQKIAIEVLSEKIEDYTFLMIISFIAYPRGATWKLETEKEKRNKAKVHTLFHMFQEHLADDEWFSFFNSDFEKNFQILIQMDLDLVIKCFTKFVHLTHQGIINKEQLKNLLANASFLHTSEVFALLGPKEKSLQDVACLVPIRVVLDVMFQTRDLEHINYLIQNKLNKYTSPFLDLILNIEFLQQLRQYFMSLDGDFCKDFFQNTLLQCTMEDTNIIEFSVYEQNDKVLHFLLTVCQLNPHFVSNQPPRDVVSWLHALCIDNPGYIDFFKNILPWLDPYVERYNSAKNPKDRTLSHPYKSTEGYSPICSALSVGGLEFAKFLLCETPINYLAELSFAPLEVNNYPLLNWYSQKSWSCDTHQITALVVDKGPPIKDLIQILFESLLLKRTRQQSSTLNQEKITILEQQAKTAFNNILYHPLLKSLVGQIYEQPKCRLQQLAIISKNKKIAQHVIISASENNSSLHATGTCKNVSLSPLLNLYILLSLITMEFPMAYFLMGSVKKDDLYSILNFIERLLKRCHDKENLGEMINHFGYNRVEVPQFKSLLSHLDLSKPNSQDLNEIEIQAAINSLEYSLEDIISKKMCKDKELDKEFDQLIELINAYQGTKVKEFKETHKVLLHKWQKYQEKMTRSMKPVGSVDHSLLEGRPPGTCSRDPEISSNERTFGVHQDRTGSRGQVAGRRHINCQQTLLDKPLPDEHDVLDLMEDKATTVFIPSIISNKFDVLDSSKVTKSVRRSSQSKKPIPSPEFKPKNENPPSQPSTRPPLSYPKGQPLLNNNGSLNNQHNRTKACKQTMGTQHWSHQQQPLMAEEKKISKEGVRTSSYFLTRTKMPVSLETMDCANFAVSWNVPVKVKAPKEKAVETTETSSKQIPTTQTIPPKAQIILAAVQNPVVAQTLPAAGLIPAVAQTRSTPMPIILLPTACPGDLSIFAKTQDHAASHKPPVDAPKTKFLLSSPEVKLEPLPPILEHRDLHCVTAEVNSHETNLLHYIFLYLKQMLSDLNYFEIKIKSHLQNPRLPNIGKEAYIRAQNVREQIKNLNKIWLINHDKFTDTECLKRAKIWEKVGFGVEPDATLCINEFEDALAKKASLPGTNHTALFYLWNTFISTHLNLLTILKTVHKKSQIDNNSDIAIFITELTQKLHHSFLPVRFKTQEEELVHQKVTEMVEFIKIDLRNGSFEPLCGPVLEYGSHIGSYVGLAELPRSDYDFRVSVTHSQLTSIVTIIPRITEVLLKIQACDKSCATVKLVSFPQPRTSSDAKSCSFELSLFNGGQKIKVDMGFTTESNEAIMKEAVFPISMCYFNPKTGTIFNPLNSFALKMLLELSYYEQGIIFRSSKKHIDLWLKDSSKIAFMLRMLAKFQVYPECINPTLLRVVDTALRLITGSPVQEKNALTALFGKESLILSRLHMIIIDHNFAFVFGLEDIDNRMFLNWISGIFLQKEQHMLGWSRPCAGNIATFEYIALMLQQTYRSMGNQPTSKKLERIRELASKCLSRTYASAALQLVIDMKHHLDAPERKVPYNRAGILCELFELREFYLPSHNQFSYFSTQFSITPAANPTSSPHSF
jgi:hypothetical protein